MHLFLVLLVGHISVKCCETISENRRDNRCADEYSIREVRDFSKKRSQQKKVFLALMTNRLKDHNIDLEQCGTVLEQLGATFRNVIFEKRKRGRWMRKVAVRVSPSERDSMTFLSAVIIDRPAGSHFGPFGDSDESEPTERRSANFSIYSSNYGKVRDTPTIGRY